MKRSIASPRRAARRAPQPSRLALTPFALCLAGPALAGDVCVLDDGGGNQDTKGSTATGTDATACGTDNQANGDHSTAVGHGNRADGQSSVAVGTAPAPPMTAPWPWA